MFHIRSARRTVDSKIDENRCKQKYAGTNPGNGYFIQVYYINCLKLQYYIDRYLPVSMDKIQCDIVLLFCIFKTSVLSICRMNPVFYTLSHLYYIFVAWGE